MCVHAYVHMSLCPCLCGGAITYVFESGEAEVTDEVTPSFSIGAGFPDSVSHPDTASVTD